MARAKRTDRAEARRRYRAANAEPLDDLDDLDDELLAAETDPRTTGATPPKPAKSAPAAAAATATAASGARPRPSMGAAFRSAFRPIDIPGDLRALPRLLINRAFFIPAAMIVAVAVVVVVTGGQEIISRELSQFVLAPPPLAPVFIAGFLAPRASWLLGGLLGVLQSVAVLAILATPSLGALTGIPDTGTLASSLVVSVVFGGFYAAAMAWYKRFLRAANPPRAATTSGRAPNKSAKGRTATR